jgi:hypothetical protein
VEKMMAPARAGIITRKAIYDAGCPKILSVGGNGFWNKRY